MCFGVIVFARLSAAMLPASADETHRGVVLGPRHPAPCRSARRLSERSQTDSIHLELLRPLI